MSGLWLTGLILVPLLSGTALLGVLLFRTEHRSDGQYMTLGITGLATVCAAALAFNGEQVVPFQLTWLPNAGPMTFSLGTTGLYAALATTAAAFLALLPYHLPSRESTRPVYHHAKVCAPSIPSYGLLLLTLAAANTAFLSGHFLGRYVALEIAGVCVALVPLLTLARDAGPRLAKFVYRVLRVGDTGFLIAMLSQMNAAGTLDIGPALESSATLSATRLTWVIIGFVLAVWVKIGAWPFEGWQQVGEQFDLTSHAWIYATVMPNLGLYLLYRVTPLLALQPVLQTWVLWLGLGGMVLVTIAALLRSDLRSALVYLNAAQAGLALYLAAGGLYKLIITLMVVMTPLRLLLLWSSDLIQNESPRTRRTGGTFIGMAGLLLTGFNGYFVVKLAQAASTPWPALIILVIIALAVGGRYLAAAVRVWTTKPERVSETHQVWQPDILRQTTSLERILGNLAESVRTWLEVGLLERVIMEIPRAVLKLAEGIHTRLEAGLLERVITQTPRLVTEGAALLHRVVEQQGLEGTLRGTAKGVFRVNRWIQDRHTGRLRANLQWVFVVLLLIVAVLIWQGW